MQSNPPGITTRMPKILPAGIPEDSNNLTVYHLMKLLNPTNIRAEKMPFSPPTLNPAPDRVLMLGYSLFYPVVRRYFPAGHRWVLRNLTQQEFVYAGVFNSHLDSGHLGGFRNRPDGRHDWGFDLGTLIAVRTCWSDDPGAFMAGLDVRGRWAGNCFDIVVEDKVKEAMARGEIWVDVSYREREMMLNLFSANHWGKTDSE